MTVWVIKVLERSKSGIKFHLYANRLGSTSQVSGPCGITMEFSTFEDFCMELGIDYDHVFSLQ
jgi:hypothetical protein